MSILTHFQFLIPLQIDIHGTHAKCLVYLFLKVANWLENLCWSEILRWDSLYKVFRGSFWEPLRQGSPGNDWNEIFRNIVILYIKISQIWRWFQKINNFGSKNEKFKVLDVFDPEFYWQESVKTSKPENMFWVEFF